jgi:nitrate reductase NapAB chaperone NapD
VLGGGSPSLNAVGARSKAIMMPISGLVVTFASAIENHRETVDVIRGIPEVEVGVASANKLAIVVETSSQVRDQELWELVRQMPGVTDLSVALIGFDAE